MKPPQKNFALKMTTFIVVTACFFVMGFAIIVSQNLKNILTLWGEDVQMTVYLSSNISEQSRQEVERTVKNNSQVGNVTYVNQEKALGDFRVQLAGYAPDLAHDEELLKLIPTSLQVSLSKDVSAADQMSVMQKIASELRDKDGVEDISYGQDWIEKYSSLVSAFEVIIQILGIVILAATLFVMSNAIRASVQARYDDIVVLEMIGATSSTIRKPFLKEGAWLGFASSVSAILLCLGLYAVCRDLLLHKLSFLQIGQHLAFMSWVFIGVLICGGTTLGAFGSYLCVRKINNGWAGSQR